MIRESVRRSGWGEREEEKTENRSEFQPEILQKI